ncbi:MAG: hypothetical protein ACOX2K_05175 [Bacillota bacterium]
MLRAIKECATNSLKHGQSTEADLLLQEYRGGVHLTFRITAGVLMRGRWAWGSD